MPTYTDGTLELKPYFDRLVDEYADLFNSEIEQPGVKCDFLFAWPSRNEAGDPTGNAITVRGQAALGLCRITNTKERAKGHGDVEILIDGEWWADAEEHEWDALMAHEMRHIEPIRGKEVWDEETKQYKPGRVKKDSNDRPRLKCRRHDVEMGWFDVIAQRFDGSLEREQARRFVKNKGRFYFPEGFNQQGEFVFGVGEVDLSGSVRNFTQRMRDVVGPGESVSISIDGREAVTIQNAAATA